jgi:hypothetical protein
MILDSITITSANANVYVANTAGVIAGVYVGDIFEFLPNIPYTKNRRVTMIYPGFDSTGNVIVLDANANTSLSGGVSFRHQTTGTGLWAATGIEAYFIKSSPSYSPEVDPRLPKHYTITNDLTATSDIITVSNIAAFPDPGFIYCTTTVTANVVASGNLLVHLTSLGGVELGQNVITANIGKGTTVRVSKIYRANSSILLSNVDSLLGNVTISNGETVYFDPVTRVGGIRIGQEVIWYNHAWTSNGALTSITRNVGNTSPATYPNVANTVSAGSLITVLGVRTLHI